MWKQTTLVQRSTSIRNNSKIGTRKERQEKCAVFWNPRSSALYLCDFIRWNRPQPLHAEATIGKQLAVPKNITLTDTNAACQIKMIGVTDQRTSGKNITKAQDKTTKTIREAAGCVNMEKSNIYLLGRGKMKICSNEMLKGKISKHSNKLCTSSTWVQENSMNQKRIRS